MIVGSSYLAVRAGRDDRQNAAHQQAFPETVAVIALITEQRLGRGDGYLHERFGGNVVRDLAAGRDEA